MDKDTHSEPVHSVSRLPIGNDNNPSLSDIKRVDHPSFLADLVMGVRFYSRLPTGSAPHAPPELSRIAPPLALVSVIIGLAPAIILFLSAWSGLPILLGICFAVIAQILTTGAMAEDALADSADGLWGGQTAARRLEIMKDPSHGTYGVLAIVMLVATRLAALISLMIYSGLGGALVWLAAQVISRQMALYPVTSLPPARPDGVAATAGALSLRSFTIGGVIAGLILIVLAGAFVGIAGLVVTLFIQGLIAWLWSRLCQRKFGGYSGDLIGALQALLEIAALTTFILFI